ncbi:hypothetical protein COV20_04635 [Candidatus Woesearchaeota archaeon CG10_big_fil_rev_8_21_14_0_10_45_16]|nr:MAG: hypothetical protein COV20_04635 [Candidatus Woesearchaeota archaeon CG10_big_fil_rev_8_21_14_0_10_45_16]
MNLIQESYERLFPEKEFSYNAKMEYNRRLAPFNANIALHRNVLSVNMNLQWKDIDEEIKIGLIQHLLLKIFRKKGMTQNIELYNNFTKNIHILTPKDKIDPQLEISFDRVNKLFLESSLEKPNLCWGTDSRRKLAHYNFHNDTITVSTIFKEAAPHVLDYVMYHEMLHKHFKFEHNNGRSSYHSPAFKAAERQYPEYQEIEKEITGLIRGMKKKPASLWRFFR